MRIAERCPRLASFAVWACVAGLCAGFWAAVITAVITYF